MRILHNFNESDNKKIQEVSAKIETRAYVMPETIKFDGPIMALQPLPLAVNYMNYGRTPANDLSFRGEIVYSNGLPKNAPDYKVINNDAWFVAPGKSYLISGHNDTLKNLDAEEWLNGEKDLYAFLLIRYTDVFDKACSTQVCAKFDKDTEGFVKTGRLDYVRWDEPSPYPIIPHYLTLAHPAYKISIFAFRRYLSYITYYFAIISRISYTISY